MSTVVEVIASAMKSRGIRYFFGIPGSGAALDLIEAAGDAGVEFVLTGHESTAAAMAAVYGEVVGQAGVCLSIMGPGAANLAGGVGYAFLEQAPVIALKASRPTVIDCVLDPEAYDRIIKQVRG